MPNEKTHYQVIVVGGGTAGIVAATQAARAGAKTLLVEKSGQLGGTITAGGVNNPGLFHAWGRQIIAGIGWELILHTLETTGTSLPETLADYQLPHSRHHIKVDRFIFAALADEMIVTSGSMLLLHTMIAAVTPRPGYSGWDVTLCTKSGLQRVTTEVVIDCSGDANVVSLAGFEVVMPQCHQPATLSCQVSGYDADTLDYDALDKAFTAAVAAGDLTFADASWSADRANIAKWLKAYGANANHILSDNAHSSTGKTALELEARRALLRLYRFLRRQPRLGSLKIDHMAPECGVRESVTIKGETTITAEDYITGRSWPDGVCNAFYPIDIHLPSGSGLHNRVLAYGTLPTVPRGALLPAGSRNLLVAGRTIASDQTANSALRVQATSMATGQAAGALAALATASRIDPAEVPMTDLYTLLSEHDAILPGHSRPFN